MLALATSLAACVDGGPASDVDPSRGAGPSFENEDETSIAHRASALATRPTTAPPARMSTAAVGALPGTGWVGHDGGYHYNIPIEVPPGRGGMAPTLAIDYSSRDGNGPLGVGFSLEGASSISRCEKAYAAGGARDRLTYKAIVDAFCLDGKRLVLVSGNAGAVGSQYRPELDNFTRVTISTKSGNETITKWTAETKDGRTIIYEPLADTVATNSAEPWTVRQLVTANGSNNGAATAVQLVWPMTKQWDRSGNGMKYSYVRSSGPTNDGGADVPLLSQVDYTTCEVTPCDFADTVRPRRVNLVYEPRPVEDRLERWANGVVVRTNVRLKNILTLVQADGGTWWPQRDYTLTYFTDYTDPTLHRVTKRSLLQSVQMCDSPLGNPQRVCLIATTFDWQSRAEHKARAGSFESSFNYNGFVGKAAQMEYVVVDANGDGNDDLVVHQPNQAANSSTGEFAANTTYAERILIADGGGQFRTVTSVDWSFGACKSLTHLGMSQPVDLDGDGRTELVVECRNYGVLAWNPSAASLVEVSAPGISDRSQPNAAVAPNPYRGAEGYLKFADLLGDGLPDLFMPGSASDGPFTRWYRQDAQSAAATGLSPRVSYVNRRTTDVRTAGPVQGNVTIVPQVTTVLDLDGDGHQELVQMDYARAMRSYEDPPSGTDAYSYRFHDAANNVKWVKDVESAGEPVSGTENWGSATYTGASTGEGLWYFADVNGDGLKDALYTTLLTAAPTYSFSLRINTGEGFLAPVVLANANCGPTWVGPKGADQNLLIADFNGDGRDDLAKLSGTIHLAAPNWTGHAGTRDPIKVCYSNGGGFDPPINLPVPNDGYRLFTDKDRIETVNPIGFVEYPAERFTMTQVGDFNGDGIADIVDFMAGTASGFTQGNRKPITLQLDPAFIRGGVDLVTKVSDGRGVRQTVVYDTLSAGTRNRVANPNAGVLRDTHLPSAGSYPTASLQKGAAVRVHTDSGHAIRGRQSRTLHLYEGARTDVTGRGFVGFNRHYTIDEPTGDVTQYDFTTIPRSGGALLYYQYPEAMRPTMTQARTQLAATTELTAPSTTLGPVASVMPAPRVTHTELYEGHPLRLAHVFHDDTDAIRPAGGGPVANTGTNVFTELDYDDWGNVISEVVQNNQTANPAFTAFYSRSITRTFDNTINATTWRLGELRRAMESNQSPDPYVTSSNLTDTRSSEYYYDAKGRLEWIVREPNISTTTPQGSNGELTMTRFTRNNAGQVTTTRRYSPTGTACASNANCSAGQECTNATTGAVMQCWNTRADTIGYDVSGTFAEKFTNALGQTRWVLYDTTALTPYLTSDENGLETVFTRDNFGRLRKASSGTGAALTVTYARDTSVSGAPYDVVRTSTAGGGQGSEFVDTLGRSRYRTWSTFSGGSGVYEYGFDVLGNVTSMRYASSTSSESTMAATAVLVGQAVASGTQSAKAKYDQAGRLVSSSRGTNETSSYFYPAYNETSVIDGAAQVSNTIVDSLGRVVVRKQGTNTISYRYKGDGALASVTGPDGHIDRFYADKLGRRTQWITGAVGGGTMERLGSVVYDSLDRMTGFSRDGVAITQTYDALDRVLTRASGTEAQTYVWDTGAVGRLKRAFNNDLSHDIVNTYDTLGRLKESREKHANGATSLSFGYDYDTFGRLSQLRYPEASGSGDVSAATHTSKGGFTVQYNYQNGQLLSLTEVATGAILWRADTRHVLGMATAATYGAPTDANRLTATWAYNASTLRLESHNVGLVSSVPAPAQSYTYFDDGTLKTRASSGINESYTYEGSLGFLKTYHRDAGAGQKVVDATFSYDDTGITGIDTTASTNSPDWPLSDETYTSDTPDYTYRLNFHQVGSTPRRRFGYDTKGRVDLVTDNGAACTTASQCPAGDSCQIGFCWHNRRSLTWNSFNLPTQIQDFATGVTRTFGYDAFGNRVRKTQDANNQVLYLGKLYEQRNLTALSARESVYRLYTDVGVVAELIHPWGGTTRTTRYLFTDHQGSVAYSVVNRVSTQLGFFPYGKRMGTAPTQNFSQLGYTGHYQDDDLDVINMGGRIYDVGVRRFYTRDAVMDSPLKVFGTNAYSYVVHDPINRIDPTGFTSGGYQGENNGRECDASGNCTMNPIIVQGPTAPPPPPPPPDRVTNHALPPPPTAVPPNPGPPPSAPPPAPPAPPPPVLAPPGYAEQMAAASSDILSRMQRLTAIPEVPTDGLLGQAFNVVMQGVAAEKPYTVGVDSQRQPSPVVEAVAKALEPALAHAVEGAMEKWNLFPPNNGAATEQLTVVEKGTLLSRYGLPRGKFFAPADVPFSQRALPPEILTVTGEDEDNGRYHLYQVLIPFTAFEGRSLPLRDGTAGGGGQQIRPTFGRSATDLVLSGNLVELVGPAPPPK